MYRYQTERGYYYDPKSVGAAVVQTLIYADFFYTGYFGEQKEDEKTENIGTGTGLPLPYYFSDVDLTSAFIRNQMISNKNAGCSGSSGSGGNGNEEEAAAKSVVVCSPASATKATTTPLLDSPPLAPLLPSAIGQTAPASGVVINQED